MVDTFWEKLTDPLGGDDFPRFWIFTSGYPKTIRGRLYTGLWTWYGKDYYLEDW